MKTSDMNLPEKLNTALAVRRNIPETALEPLSPIERNIWEASTKMALSDYPDDELVGHVKKLATLIAKDAGIREVDVYSVTRFLDILKKYYYSLSLREVKVAFELGMTGQLDEYLPKDKNGYPDCHHYQSFSVEYVTKILNAYKKKFNDVQAKAYTELPEPKREVSESEKEYYISRYNNMARNAFRMYKYKGIIHPQMNDMIVYNQLDRMGVAEPIQVSELDIKKAISIQGQKNHQGVINDFIASCVRVQGGRHDLVQSAAYELARVRAIRETFDYMINNDISI
jgi:hypothetical protein